MTVDLPNAGIVKIDGLSQAGHALLAAEHGADMLGFVFAPSRRMVDPEAARIIIDHVREVMGENSPMMVGVFVEPRSDELLDVVERSGIDRAQLHGRIFCDNVSSLPFQVIRSIGPPPGSSARQVVDQIDEFANADLAIVDGYDPVQHGGRGTRADWDLVRDIARQRRVMLAGGLTPSNVGEAIRTVRPAGVDVSSGVETEGQKDPELIIAFIEQAREAFASLQHSSHR